MSVHFWGENPKGTWKVHARNNDYDSVREFHRYKIILAQSPFDVIVVIFYFFYLFIVQKCKAARSVTFGDMKLILYGTKDEPSVVGLEPKPQNAINRSLNDSEDMLEDKQDSYLGNNLEQQNVELNEETSWNDLVGGKFLVREDNNLF